MFSAIYKKEIAISAAVLISVISILWLINLFPKSIEDALNAHYQLDMNQSDSDSLGLDRIKKSLKYFTESFRGMWGNEFQITKDILEWSIGEYEKDENAGIRKEIGNTIRKQIKDLDNVYIRIINRRFLIMKYLLLILSLAILALVAMAFYSSIRNVRYLETIHLSRQNLIRFQKIREGERSRIASYLHDSILQDLGAVLMRDEITSSPELRKDIDTIITNLRNVTYSTSPIHLHNLGLEESLRELIQTYRKIKPINIKFTSGIYDTSILDEDTKLVFYRIIQESLNNIMKHSKADEVHISLVESHPYLILKIRDNGQGFERTNVLENIQIDKHFGLTLMEQLVKSIGGQFNIETTPGEGTSIKMKYDLTGKEMSWTI